MNTVRHYKTVSSKRHDWSVPLCKFTKMLLLLSVFVMIIMFIVHENVFRCHCIALLHFYCAVICNVMF